MKRNYAESLSKEYLEYLGITKVSEDGKEIWKDNKLLKLHLNNAGYYIVMLYDPIKRQQVPKECRTSASGELYIGVHRLVYAWFNKFIPNGLVVDHISGDKLDNNINNLRLLTPSENTWRGRICHVREVKCKLNKPRTFYEEKLSTLETQYEVSKAEHRAKDSHALRSEISRLRAQLRYYDRHTKENEV